ncbi:hypothetical protein FEM48_Zijuj04G0196600 [Ziziphus jujuba var. spinosa]|uniref:Uncharacterized protein n=1 Tax=Ziziphus jujuba var. spinosa TaxID=714518 RepID=A0A978VLT3_ZIZJJ|nr:hypothetical protein FEM48_Zijuj04G0196600 [Ziziphus jujuba var. spinosa]
MGVVLKKLRIRKLLSRKIEILHRNNVRSWRKQLKPIKQRSFTRKRKSTRSRCGDLLLLLLYFTCFGSILNIIRRFVSNKVLREQLKPRNEVYTGRHADHGRPVMYLRSGASPWGIFRFPHKAASLLVAISAFLSSIIRCPTVRITSQHFIGRRGQTPSFLVYINAFVSSTVRSPTVIIAGQHFIVGYSIYSACRWASDIGIRRNVSKAANSRLAEEETSGYGVSIKFNLAFLKGLALDILVFAAWWICCYVLELTTDITSFQLGWIILTSTIWRVLFVPVDPAEKEDRNSSVVFWLSVAVDYSIGEYKFFPGLDYTEFSSEGIIYPISISYVTCTGSAVKHDPEGAVQQHTDGSSNYTTCYICPSSSSS